MVWGTFFPRCPGVQRLAKMVWGTFFPTLPGGVRACQDDLGHFFPRLTEGGGGLSYLGNALIGLGKYMRPSRT